MPKYQRCDDSVPKMARELMQQFETHQPLLDAEVKIDFVFAYGDRDDDGNLLGDALKRNGVKALGIARKLSLKDRALGRGDAEIALDGDWWESHSEREVRALLDHELHHLQVCAGKLDDLGRPVLKLRPHDFEFGWFKQIAARHDAFSQERIQAALMMDSAGQYFWPSLAEDHAKPELQPTH